MSKLTTEEIGVLISLAKWERNLVAVAVGIIGSAGSGLLVWMSSHKNEIIGEWWAGEHLDRAVAAIVLFTAYAAIHIWQCLRYRKKSDEAMKLLNRHGAIKPEVGRLLVGGNRTFQLVMWIPVVMLFGILISILY